MGMKQFDAVFDIVDVKQDESGNYVALIDKFGNEISFKDGDGNPIPFSKDAVDRFLNSKNCSYGERREGE